MGSFTFNQFPVNFYVPGVYAEYDASKLIVSSGVLPQKILVIGQMLAAGSATADVAVRATSADDAGRLAGRGSMLHQMAIAAFALNASIPVYLLPLADDDTATASERDITIGGSPTESGTLALYVGGRRYAIAITSGETATAIGAAIAAAITADTLAYVTASAVTGVVTITARNAGLDAGVIDARHSLYSDERLPAGLTVSVGALTAGTVNPDISLALDALGDQWFPTIAYPYTDSANFALLLAEMASRNGPIRQIEGVSFAAQRDTISNLITAVEAQNYPALSLLDGNNFLEPPYVAAASSAYVQAFSAQNDPGMPEQTLEMPGLTAVPEGERRTILERQQLIAAGVSTCVVDDGGTVRAERYTSTYRKNANGVDDLGQFDVIPFRLWAQTRYSLRLRFSTTYARYKLGQDGSRGPNVMTPSLAKSECVTMYVDFMDRGWYEGGAAFEQFKATLQAEIDTDDRNRLNILFPPDFINQLRVTAALVQPRG